MNTPRASEGVHGIPAYEHLALEVTTLRWRCDPQQFGFETTLDVEPLHGVVGQDAAMEALRFGLEVNAPGQNIFVRGLTGTGRSTLLRRLLESIRPDLRSAPDRVYVHNFETPDRPRLLTLARGEGSAFRKGMETFVAFVRQELAPALASDLVRGRVAEVDRRTQRAVEAVGKPFDVELREAGLTLVQVQVGPTTRPLIAPLVDGEPASAEKMEELRKAEKITEAELEALSEKIEVFAQRLQEVGRKIQEIQHDRREAIQSLTEEVARELLAGATSDLRTRFPDEKVGAFLDAVTHDILTERLAALGEDTGFTQLYQVNLIQCHEDHEGPPIVIENTPSLPTLVGSIDRMLGEDGENLIPHMMVRGGSLLQADGGYLILEARDLLVEPGAWRSLIRTLRTGRVELVPPEIPLPWRAPMVKPEPIPVSVKVVLLGDSQLYYMLDAMDPDFPHLFKVLADFESTIDRTPDALNLYAAMLSRLAREETLPPFGRSAVAALCEHGARIASEPDKLTVRFGRLADIAREAAFLATKSGQGTVTGDHVGSAIGRSKDRADLPARRFRSMVADGRIRVQTHGAAVGQVNGLAVIQAGPLTYGFPMRITATIGPGTAGTINIEREAELSGAIHNKSFYILGGLLRYLLRTSHPLAFDASIAFEQSYGGIDGDSASGAEMCCLLSALTDLPLRQDLAMTGAIDQLGNILPIGAVNEKIEGYYDTCRSVCLTCSQGVIIPRTNVGDLMLRPDVVEACEQGKFHVYAVGTIHEALGIFTGRAPGLRDADGTYAVSSVLGQAVKRAGEFWQMAAPASLSARD
jgi:predicted ATP-dependent protease